EYLVQLLERYGIDTVFGIPGNHTVQLYRGLSRAGLRHVSPRHEQGAVFMADGYARASGKPAACFLISGPGLGNAVTPLLQALADSIPVLVVSAVAARDQLGMGEGRLHEVPDQRLLASQCTRFSHTLMRPNELPKVLARAFAVFDGQRPGPVHIEIPLDVITMDAGKLPVRIWPRMHPPGPDGRAIKQLAERLTNATSPVLIVGGGGVEAVGEVRDLAEWLDLPVVTTVNGKGVLPPDHPLLVKGSPSLPCVRDALIASDCVLAVGTEFGETDYDMLFAGELRGLQWLARIDIDPQQFARNQMADLAICSDSVLAMNALLNRLRSETTESARQHTVSGGKRCRELNRRVLTEPHYHRDMAAFFAAIKDSLPGLCLVGDSTLPTYYAVWQYEAPSTRRYFHSATGMGTLGYAIPAAIGACRALESEVPVVALIGDGAAQFTAMELASAVQERLPIIVLLWNNHGYREIKAGMLAADVEPVGVDISPPDFLPLAQSLHCDSLRVDGIEELGLALKQAWSTAREASRPTLLELSEEMFLSHPAGTWYADAH
ncbi:MAG: 5-guanidino-2-oxopentanoate decarboxylase, partial [Pseudomonadota bacterium]